MIEHHSYHTFHGMPLQFKTNHTALASAADPFLRYFPQLSANGTEPMSVTFSAVSDWNDFPSLPSSHPAPDAPEQAPGTEFGKTTTRRMYYLNPDCLVREDPNQGFRMVIHEQQGVANGYFVDPESLAAEYQMRLLHFAISRLLTVKGYYTLHATSLEMNGRGILIPGKSGQGKTTTFLSLLRSGYRSLSDDHPLLHENDNGLEILPFPEKVDVTEDTIKLFPELQQADSLLYPGMNKRFFYVEDIYPHGPGRPCQPGLILFPEVIDEPTSVVEPMPKKQAFELLLQQGVWIQQNTVAQHQFQMLSRLVAQTACYRLLFGRNVLALPELIDPLVGRN